MLFPPMAPTIEKIERIEFEYPIQDAGAPKGGFARMYSSIYEPGSVLKRSAFAIRIHTDTDYTGEYVCAMTAAGVRQMDYFADSLIGKNPLDRELIWTNIKRLLRATDKLGLGPVDIALWDFAGKYRSAPIHELLGTYREKLPTQASTNHGQRTGEGGLNSPEAYADFAEECLELGYPSFKIHGFDLEDSQEQYRLDIEAIEAVADRVGDDMDLMFDASCKYETWAHALAVGEVLDEQGYFWYEDPYLDGGTSQHGHNKLSQHIKTPLLQTEMIRGVEQTTDFVASGATDYVRADPDYDGGITGAMKIARVAEGFGLDVEYHAPGVARRHCMAATRNSNYYEISILNPDFENPVDVPSYKGDYSDSLHAVDDEGNVPVPNEPGLGVDIDWEFIGDHETDRVIYE